MICLALILPERGTEFSLRLKASKIKNKRGRRNPGLLSRQLSGAFPLLRVTKGPHDPSNKLSS
jgi:hypothetical protein